MRIIHYSNESGSREGIYVTEDMEIAAVDVCPPGYAITSDFDPEEDGFPSTFPLDYNLEKQ